jgi:putative photosynthetic complex assembly protein 2
MTQWLPAVAYTLFVWWASTGVIVYLDGLPARTHRWTMLGATFVLAGGLCGLAATAGDTSVAGAYIAFTCAVLVWAWQEVAFLLGYVTGPRRLPCPAGCRGWRRVRYAIATILHHEIALLVLGGAVVALTWNDVNQTGALTFAALWTMRQSAKLNLFLGVRNFGEEFLPRQLRYLESYFTRRAMNPLFPVSLTAACVAAVLAWQRALADDAGAASAAGFALVGTLVAAAILEHLFMVIPLPSTWLWRWGLRSHAAAAPAASATSAPSATERRRR